MSSIGRTVATTLAAKERMGIKNKTSFKTIGNDKLTVHTEISRNHPAMLDPASLNMQQQRVDVVGSRQKIDFAGPPLYRNLATSEAVNTQLKMMMDDPNSELMQKMNAAIMRQDDAVKRKIPKNQLGMIASGRSRGYNQVSNIGVQMPNAPMGIPTARSYQTTDDSEALNQMQNPNPSQYYADAGGETSMMMSTPPATYIQDPVSMAKARQGGYAYSRQVPTGPADHPEVQIRHNPMAPLPSKMYLPAMNLNGPGYVTNNNRPGL